MWRNKAWCKILCFLEQDNAQKPRKVIAPQTDAKSRWKGGGWVIYGWHGADLVEHQILVPKSVGRGFESWPGSNLGHVIWPHVPVTDQYYLVPTDLSVTFFHISPAFFETSVTEIPGNSSLILDLFSLSHRKYADCGLFGLSGSTSFFGCQQRQTEHTAISCIILLKNRNMV